VFDKERTSKSIIEQSQKLDREFVIRVKGNVIGHTLNNIKYSPGDIEILVSELTILNDVPPFTIEDETDGGEELHIQYRYLDICHNLVINNFN